MTDTTSKKFTAQDFPSIKHKNTYNVLTYLCVHKLEIGQLNYLAMSIKSMPLYRVAQKISNYGIINRYISYQIVLKHANEVRFVSQLKVSNKYHNITTWNYIFYAWPIFMILIIMHELRSCDMGHKRKNEISKCSFWHQLTLPSK